MTELEKEILHGYSNGLTIESLSEIYNISEKEIETLIKDNGDYLSEIGGEE